MEIVLVVMALAAGAGLPVQAAVNAEMGRWVGRPEWAAAVNFGVGFVGLLAVLALQRVPPPALATLGRAPFWAWGGGLLGAAFVTAVVVLAPRLGVATTLGLTVAGQLFAAVALDHFGLFGLASRPAGLSRIAGAALLVGGVLLLRR